MHMAKTRSPPLGSACNIGDGGVHRSGAHRVDLHISTTKHDAMLLLATRAFPVSVNNTG
jgi:hypothetical protein